MIEKIILRKTKLDRWLKKHLVLYFIGLWVFYGLFLIFGVSLWALLGGGVVWLIMKSPF
nr:hypothetical protein [uncultured Niameybacter sp.]